jgi:hypothetical protein
VHGVTRINFGCFMILILYIKIFNIVLDGFVMKFETTFK